MDKRCFFAGTNSGRGFYSLFSNVFSTQAKRVYLLKGGPGTGKSRFIRDLTSELAELGYKQELFFCSSDAESLDAVFFPSIGVAIVDATMPHALEPELPGCRDEIVYLGSYWSTSGLSSQRGVIEELGQTKQRCFAKAFKYLEGARLIFEAITAEEKQKETPLQGFLDNLIPLFKAKEAKSRGNERHLFASAFTPQGYVSHIGSLTKDYKQIYLLRGGNLEAKKTCLQSAAYLATLKGFDVEILHDPLEPRRFSHLLVPSLDLAVITDSPFNALQGIRGKVIDCGPVNYNKNSQFHLFQALIDQAILALQQAQNFHSELESLYQAHMDFAAVTEHRKKIVAEILNL